MRLKLSTEIQASERIKDSILVLVRKMLYRLTRTKVGHSKRRSKFPLNF